MDSHSSNSHVRVKIKQFREEYYIGVGDPKIESTIVAEPCLPDNFSRCRVPEDVKEKEPSSACSDIIEAEGDPVALERLLGQKRDKSASSSQNSQGQNLGPVNPTPSGTLTPPSPKRQRIEGTSEIPNTNPTTQLSTELNRPPPADRVPDKWWLYFREFESDEDMNVTSIFDHRFQMNEAIEGNLCKPADRARIQKVGLHNTAIMAQSMATRTSFLAHGLGHDIEVLEKENSELRQKLKILGNAENIIKDLSQKLAKLEVEAGRAASLSEEVDNQKSRIRELETENKTLSEEKLSLTSTTTLLRDEKDKVQADFDAATKVWQMEERELKTDLALYHGNGFNKAIEQVQFLYPELDASQMGMFKEIVNGELVESE
ncbi:hypothetical protein SESBI_31616 [Sesbania bispinosa]|nr:hypothetical protein SESBI_31616 [Sesbania bispinosa]